MVCIYINPFHQLPQFIIEVSSFSPSLETAHTSRDNFLSYSCMHKQPLALELLLHVQQINLRQGKWGWNFASSIYLTQELLFIDLFTLSYVLFVYSSYYLLTFLVLRGFYRGRIIEMHTTSWRLHVLSSTNALYWSRLGTILFVLKLEKESEYGLADRLGINLLF